MFLTVQEAIDLCGRSQTTVHRLCQKYDGSKFIKKENNKYFVDSEFLLEKYPVEKGTETAIAAFAENNEIPEKIMETNISESKENNLFYENRLKEKDSEIERLKEELLDSHQDLAEVTEANLQIQALMKLKKKKNFSDIVQLALQFL